MTIGVSRTLLLPLVILLSLSSAAQKKELEEKVVSELMEKWIENSEATLDYTDLQDQLEYYMKNRIDLNRSSREDLQKLFFLSEKQISAIIRHRREYGDYIAIYELQSIEELDERTLYYLSWFVAVHRDLNADQTPFFSMIAKGRHELLLLHDNDFQQRAGYNSDLVMSGKTHYLGTPYRYVTRYRFNYAGRLSFGYTGEKDMGEQFFEGAQKNGFDFNSAHFLLRNTGRWKTIALGDYQANFGQGLTFGSGISARKSAYVLNVRRSFQMIRPYRSLNENEFLRGAAATCQLSKSVDLTAFGSYKYISTNYREPDSLQGFDDNFSSIQATGLHRTSTEIASRNNVLQQIYGGHLRWRESNLDIGLTGISTQYNITFLKGDKPYQLYNFSGTQLSNAGIDYNFYLGNVNFFGEVSLSSNGAMAGIGGLTVPLHQTLDAVLVYRNYARDYQTTFNNPFGENSDGRNEEGIYSGISFRPNRHWIMNVYFDAYKSPWLRYQVDGPSRGTDLLSELQYNPSRSTQVYFRYKHEEKTKNLAGNEARLDFTSVTSRDVYRFHIQYKLSAEFSARTRLEHVIFDQPGSSEGGTLIFQELSYNTPFKELSLTGRIALFEVEDFNARVYANESDVLYQYAVPLYQNSGIRYFLLLHYRVNRTIDVWLKYSQTTYSNVSSISSGLEKIEGNSLSDLRAQVRLVF